MKISFVAGEIVASVGTLAVAAFAGGLFALGAFAVAGVIRAGMSRITWKRWRSGACSPRVDNLHAVEVAARAEVLRLEKAARRSGDRAACAKRAENNIVGDPAKPRDHVNT